MENKRETILITGGAGFIGSHIADKLIKRGYKIIIVDNLSSGRKENLNSKAKFYKADICDIKISKIFQKERPQIVIHMAAQVSIAKSVENPVRDAEINILGSINILENCRKSKVKKIIFSSSAAVYGRVDTFPTPETCKTRPLLPYGIAKLTIENYLNYYCKTHGLVSVILRFANIYGPRQDFKGEAGVVAIFCNKIISGKQPIIYGTGAQTRDFVYVDDVAEAVVTSVLKKDAVGIFNISTGKETSINDIFEIINNKTGAKFVKKYAAEKSAGEQKSCLDYAKAKKELGWQPKNVLQEGLMLTLESFKGKV